MQYNSQNTSTAHKYILYNLIAALRLQVILRGAMIWQLCKSSALVNKFRNSSIEGGRGRQGKD